MKSILIIIYALGLGGVESSLLGMLETIDTTRFNVDLFLMRHSGELIKKIPDHINLLPEISEYSCLGVPIKDVLKRGKFKIAFGRLRGKIKAHQRVKALKLRPENYVAVEYSHKYTLKYMPCVSTKEYDLAISFLTPHYFVAEKVKAKKKIAWIHTDYSTVDIDIASELLMWEKYDNIISISENVTESFLSVFPELRNKIVLIENIMPMKLLDELVNAFPVNDEMLNDGSVKLLSIGRFSMQKNFDNVPDICKRIMEQGIDVKWYLIGFGGCEGLIRKKISELEMEQHVIVLGKKANPYPYVNACDIYIQPSRYEGKSVAVREAQTLHKPVIITNYATSASQLTDGYDGVIVPMDNEGCAEGIVAVIKDQSLREKLVENTKKNDYSNAKEINKLYRILEV